MVVQLRADIAVKRRGHVIDHGVSVSAELHAGGHNALIGGVQRKRAQGQGRNIDPRPTPAVVAGVLDVAAGGGGGLDNIRRHGRAGYAVVGGRNAAIVLVRKVHHEIDRVFVRGRVVGIRRGPCGGIIVLGGGERLGGQQSHAQAERQHHAQYAGKVFRSVHRQMFSFQFSQKSNTME